MEQALVWMGYGLVVVFMALLATKRVSPLVGLITVSGAFGLVAAYLGGEGFIDGLSAVFGWIKNGVFYAQSEDGSVTSGTVNTAALLLFAIVYFCIMLSAGLFDPLCVALLKFAKGDPLRITIATAAMASVVAVDGDGTTTVLIVTAATLDLFKKMGMKMSYLAMLIVIPNSILNFLPWGGPLARVMSALDLEVTELFPVLIPSIAVAMVYVFVMAAVIGLKERRRLGWTKGSGVISDADVAGVITELKARDLELKRPKMFWVNLVMTLVIMYLLITGVGNGAVLFMVGTAIALVINYPHVADQRVRLSIAGGDAMGPVVVIFAAGALMGILNGSGMSTAIANNMIGWLPDSWGSHLPILFAVIALPGLIFLSNDAFYFGILPVMAPVAYEFGATPLDMGVAAMMGQALHFASPLVAFIYVLVDRTQITFADYAKEFLKWAWPIFPLYVAAATATGALPL